MSSIEHLSRSNLLNIPLHQSEQKDQKNGNQNEESNIEKNKSLSPLSTRDSGSNSRDTKKCHEIRDLHNSMERQRRLNQG